MKPWFQTCCRGPAGVVILAIAVVSVCTFAVDASNGIGTVLDCSPNGTCAGRDNSTEFRSTDSVPVLECGPNATCTGQDNSTRYDQVAAKSDSSGPPVWCPPGYKIVPEFLFCRPMPCVKVPEGNLSLPNGTEIVESIEEGKVTKTLCLQKFTSHLTGNCTKSYLMSSEYDVFADGSLRDRLRNDTIPLGDYWLQHDRAIICSPDDDTATVSPQYNRSVIFPEWCKPIAVSSDQIQRMPNSEFLVRDIQRTVEPYYLSENGSVTNVCIKVDMELGKCKLIQIESDEFTLQPNMDVTVNIRSSVTYPFERYFITSANILVVCAQVSEIVRKETRLLYGVASCLSAFCLLLALVVHIFYPTLNYHTKALLCLAFSLLGLYISTAVVNFNNGSFESATANIIIFAVRYIMGLSAFFWLSVIAFDLWRVFAKLKGTISPVNSEKKRRVFLAKCAYAFGTPILMYIIVVVIAVSPSAQQSLNMEIFIQQAVWFTDKSAIYALFYGPIVILLVENLIFFIMTIICIKKASQGTDLVNKKASKKLIRVYIKLFVVLGLSWLLEVISAAVDYRVDQSVWYVTDIINLSQGVFIFLIYVCKKRTWIIIKHKLGYITSSQIGQSSTTTTQESIERKTTAVNMDTISVNATVPTTATDAQQR